jgi:hypothetical protein
MMRLVLCLAVANALNVVRAPPKTQTMGAVAAWHATRKNEITRRLGRDAVAELEAPTPARTLSCLLAVNAANVYLASATPALGGLWWFVVAATVGAWCSLAQFALLHDVVHGGADVGGAPGERRRFRERVLKFGSQPSVFGYWLYLALGHLNHHAATGDFTAKQLFASSELASGQDKRAKFPTSKAPSSAIFYSFRLIFGRAIISRSGLEAWMLFPERARAEHSR